MSNKPTLRQKGRFGMQYRGAECLNCKHPLDISDRFCPNCAQANSNKRLSLKDFFEEFLASIMAYDSKLLRTLTALLTKPGKITRDYLNGKRITYTNPFRFLLSLSILYFLLFNLSTDYSSDINLNDDVEFTINDDQTTSNLEEEATNSISKSINTSIKQNKLAEANKEKEWRIRDSTILANPVAHFKKIKEKEFANRLDKKTIFFTMILDSTKVSKFNAVQKKYKIEKTLENKAAFTLASNKIRIEKQPEVFLAGVISKAPFAIFLLIPVFTLFVWLMYIRKKYTYTEHLVFGFHIQSLLFILLIISFLIDAIFGTFSTLIFFLIFAIYLFLALWKFYGQGFFKTIVKYVVLNTIFFTLALITMVLLFTGSFFTY